MSDLFARVARRANIGGLPIGAEAIQEIDRLLFEERLKSLPSLKGAAADVGGGDAERLPGNRGTHFTRSVAPGTGR